MQTTNQRLEHTGSEQKPYLRTKGAQLAQQCDRFRQDNVDLKAKNQHLEKELRTLNREISVDRLKQNLLVHDRAKPRLVGSPSASRASRQIPPSVSKTSERWASTLR